MCVGARGEVAFQSVGVHRSRTAKLHRSTLSPGVVSPWSVYRADGCHLRSSGGLVECVVV